MAKFNTATARPTVKSPVQTERAPSGRTHEGAPGFARDARSELFLLAVGNMVGENTFYERAADRDNRYADLVARVAVDDPAWTFEFLRWLRGDGNIRTAAIVGAAEAVHAMLAAGITPTPAAGARTAVAGSLVLAPAQAEVPSGRRIVDAVLQRADEPGELLAYWTKTYGRKIPKPVKRGVADGVARLYSERSLLKYDTASHGYRFGDVIDLVHPSPGEGRTHQGDLFQCALDRRHGRDNPIPERLGMLRRNALLRAEAAEGNFAGMLDPTVLAGAGMTWEDALSLAGSKLDKARLWTALIPSMGYMALLRNLRNFDQAGVSDEVADQVAAKLADPAEVARSRQFPFRFYAAHNAVGSLRWGHALEKALVASLANVPALGGRTLILIDQSPSMFPNYYRPDQAVMRDVSNADVAKMFGSALALRAADATLIGYGHRSYRVPFDRGEAVLRLMGKFRQESGTDAYGAANAHFSGHDRIVVVTDGENNGALRSWEQAGIPASVPIYSWNIGGYRLSQDPGGPNRHTFAGLTDHAFRMIPLLESGRDGTWPWLAQSSS